LSMTFNAASMRCTIWLVDLGLVHVSEYLLLSACDQGDGLEGEDSVLGVLGGFLGLDELVCFLHGFPC